MTDQQFHVSLSPVPAHYQQHSVEQCKHQLKLPEIRSGIDSELQSLAPTLSSSSDVEPYLTHQLAVDEMVAVARCHASSLRWRCCLNLLGIGAQGGDWKGEGAEIARGEEERLEGERIKISVGFHI